MERERDFTSKVLLLELQRDYFFGLMQHFLTYLLFQSKKNATATATAAAAASASSTPNSTEFNVSNIIDFFEYHNNFFYIFVIQLHGISAL